MDRTIDVPEYLDGPLDDRDALETNLRDLRRLNRLTGGTRLSVRAVRELLPAGGTVLDVGTGGADIPVALLADARRRGAPLDVTATDSRREVLDAALAARPRLDEIPGLRLALRDGRRLADGDRTFDVAHSSLVVHHLDEAEAVAFLRELRRVSRVGIVINDLARSRLNWIGALAITHAVGSGRYARHDGPLSVRRAYTRTEIRALIARAGLQPTAEYGGFAGHRYAIVAR
jgi:ubiquinone/menaquinone biosynthesis C-methylase UbiE